MMRVCDKNNLVSSEWKIENIKVIHRFDDCHQIVAGDYFKKETKLKPDKMNLGIILKILHDNKYISKSLFEKIDKTRILRNDQHFGTHEIIKEYTKNDLEFVFSVAKDVKELSRITYKGL